ncbi:GNAT family N-acetyltransferase [Oricola sp.]|uniref:GNAT family N-acetyltransferase n=1 Tax=Oricola sp. TaxID=1979950 RepID=UPI003BAB01B7
MLDRPTSTLMLRPAEIGDADVILELQRDGFGDDPHCPDRARLEAAMKNRRIDIHVAEAGGSVVGYFLLNNRPFRPWTALDYIAVHPVARGLGIGGKMIDRIVEITRRRQVRLFVRRSNTRAIEFYHRHDFVETGVREGNYFDGEDAIIMVRRIR